MKDHRNPFTLLPGCLQPTIKMALSFPPCYLLSLNTRGVLPTSVYGGGPCQYLGSEILQKQSYLGSVKNSCKKVNIWGLRITV